MRIKNKDLLLLGKKRRPTYWFRRYANFTRRFCSPAQVAQANIPDPGFHLFSPKFALPAAYVKLVREGKREADAIPGAPTEEGFVSEDSIAVTRSDSKGEEGPGIGHGDKASEDTVSSAFPRTRYFTGLLTRRLKRSRLAAQMLQEKARIFRPLEALNPNRLYYSFPKTLKEVYGHRQFWWKKRLELVKERNALRRERRQQQQSNLRQQQQRQQEEDAAPAAATSALNYEDATDEDLDDDEEEADLEHRLNERERRTMEPTEYLVPADGDICVYCGGTIPYERRASAPYPFVAQCKECVVAALPEKRPLTVEFYEQHLERLIESEGNIHLNNNGWFPPLPTWNINEDEENDGQEEEEEEGGRDIPDQRTYQDLAPKVQLFTPTEERLWQAVVEIEPFDAKRWRATYFPQRTIEQIQVKYWSRGRTLVAGGMCWSVEEGNLFFQGLRRFGKHNVWAIQEHIKTRSLAEVVAMIEAMEAEVAKIEYYGLERLRVSDMPMADEVDEDEIRLEERCAEILMEKELKARWNHDGKSANMDADEWEDAEQVNKTRLFNLKTLAELTSRVYAQNEKACIERDVVPVLYDALKQFLVPLIKELAALSHERQRVAAIKAPSRRHRLRREIMRTEISEGDVFRLLLSHQLPMGTHQFFEDLPKRLNYYVYPEQVHDPVLTVTGRKRVYDLNRDVDMARGMAPDSDVDYDSEDADDVEAERQFATQCVPLLPPVTDRRRQISPRGGHNEDDNNRQRSMMDVFDAEERAPNSIQETGAIVSDHEYSAIPEENPALNEHFGMERKADEEWRRSALAQAFIQHSAQQWQRMQSKAKEEGETWVKQQQWEKGVLHPRIRTFEPPRSSGYSTVHPTSVDFVQWRKRTEWMLTKQDNIPYDAESKDDCVSKLQNVYSPVESINKRHRSHSQIIDSRQTRLYTYCPKTQRENRLLRHASRMEKLARVGYRDVNRQYRPGYGLLPESASYLTDPWRTAASSSTTPTRPGAGFGLGFQERTGLWMREATEPKTQKPQPSSQSQPYVPHAESSRQAEKRAAAHRNTANSAFGTLDNDRYGEADGNNLERDEYSEEDGMMLDDEEGYIPVVDAKSEARELRLWKKQMLADDLVLVREEVIKRRRQIEADTVRKYLRVRFQHLRNQAWNQDYQRQYLERRNAWIRKYWNKTDYYVKKIEAALEQSRKRRKERLRMRQQIARERERDYEQREMATRKLVKMSMIWQLAHGEPELDPRFSVRYETMADAQDFIQNKIATAGPGGSFEWGGGFPTRKPVDGDSQEKIDKHKARVKATTESVRRAAERKRERQLQREQKMRDLGQQKRRQEQRDTSDSDEFDAEDLRPDPLDLTITKGLYHRRY